MASVKQHERLKAIYPAFNLMDYDHSLIMNLNFYNTEVDDNKKKKEWALQYWKEEGKDTKRISKLSDGYFVTAGAVAHMLKHREVELDQHEVNYLTKKYHELTTHPKIVEDSSEQVQMTVSKDDQMGNELTLHLGEFEAGVDMFFGAKPFDAKNYLIRNNVKPAIAKKIAEYFKPLLRELRLASSGKDEQVTEGYAYLGPRKLAKFIDYVQSMISSCEVASAIIKAAKKPKAKREKIPSEVVKSVKYLGEDQTSKLKSEHPSKIVNAKEVWIYNAKNRRLFRYVALEGMQLSVSGTSIINVDQEKSGGKIIRKPETQLKEVVESTSRPLNKLFNAIKGTLSRATGRLNEDTLIVKCF